MGAFYHPRRERDQLLLTDRGLIAEPFSNLANPTGNTLTSQVVYGTLIGLRAGDVITNIVVNVQTAGAGTVPTGIYVGVYQTGGTRLAQSSNLASNSIWTSVGYKEAPLSATYQITADDGYYVVVLQDGTWGTTAMQLSRGPNNTAAINAIGSNPAVAASQTGQATLPAPATFTNAAHAPFWLAVS